MIILKEEFKAFVRKRPELIKYVNSGEMTWQKFYEQWSLYGEDEKVWESYKKEEKKEDTKTDSFNIGSITDMIKKVDMNSVQKGVNSLQKVIELLQGFTAKDAGSVATVKNYEPRQLFKKFED